MLTSKRRRDLRSPPPPGPSPPLGLCIRPSPYPPLGRGPDAIIFDCDFGNLSQRREFQLGVSGTSRSQGQASLRRGDRHVSVMTSLLVRLPPTSLVEPPDHGAGWLARLRHRPRTKASAADRRSTISSLTVNAGLRNSVTCRSRQNPISACARQLEQINALTWRDAHPLML